MKVGAIQSFFKSAWDNSCYADCIIKLAAKINHVELTLQEIGYAMDKGIDKGYIRFNQQNYSASDNFFVTNPAEFLGVLTGKKYTVEKVRGNYVCGKNELEVDFMVLSKANGEKNIGHFVLPDWDPIQNSNTRKNGFIWTKRIFREISR